MLEYVGKILYGCQKHIASAWSFGPVSDPAGGIWGGIF
jgi:hypothetical protein